MGCGGGAGRAGGCGDGPAVVVAVAAVRCCVAGLAPGAPRYSRGDPLVLWLWLVSGLVGAVNSGGLAVYNPTGGEHVLAVVGVVMGAVFVTVAVGGLLLQWRWRHR